MVVQRLSDIWVGRWSLEGGELYVGLKVCILEVRKDISPIRMVFRTEGRLLLHKDLARLLFIAYNMAFMVRQQSWPQGWMYYRKMKCRRGFNQFLCVFCLVVIDGL
jgi:hypothetical protein